MIERISPLPLRMPMTALALLAMGAAFATTAFSHPAQEVVIYRCTDAAGNVTFQNDRRCPKGQKQEKRVVQTPRAPEPASLPAVAPSATLPVVVVESAATSTPTPAAPAAIPNPDAAPGVLPPPPLYRCHAHTGNSYLSEDGSPKDRCVTLQVSDLSGTENRSGAQACEIQQDRCERIPDQQLCEAWSQYDKQTESLVALDNPDVAAKANALYSRTRKVMTATTCAQNP